MHVVTYQTPSGRRIEACDACDDDLPISPSGESYCDVYWGRHWGFCEICCGGLTLGARVEHRGSGDMGVITSALDADGYVGVQWDTPWEHPTPPPHVPHMSQLLATP